jgi:hypothetical protein
MRVGVENVGGRWERGLTSRTRVGAENFEWVWVSVRMGCEEHFKCFGINGLIVDLLIE